MSRIAELLAREEIIEKQQRSRITWLKLKKVIGIPSYSRPKRRSMQSVVKLVLCAQLMVLLVTGQEELEDMASAFYRELFMAQPESDLEEVLVHVPARVTNVMNEARENPYTSFVHDGCQ